MPETRTIAEAPSGANPTVLPDEVREIRQIRAQARPRRWRSLLRHVRIEEVIMLVTLVAFLGLYAVLPETPELAYLFESAGKHFNGSDTFWMFLLWCAAGTVAILVIAMLPLARTGRARRVMHGVWGDAQDKRGRARATVGWFLGGMRTYLPFLACMGIYEMNRLLVPSVRGETLYDVQMAQFDIVLFGDLSAALVHRFMHQQWITDFIGWFGLTQWDIHGFCYISYIYAAPALALAMWFLGRRKEYDRFIGSLVIAGVLAYIGYMLVPVVGPKYVFDGRWLSADTGAMAFMDAVKGYTRDCFPSLHTAWTTLFLLAAWRGVRPLFWIYLPVGIGVYIATFYGGYHYVPDIIAGHALAFFAWWAAKPLREWWDRRTGAARVSPVA